MFLKLVLLNDFMRHWLENIVIGESGKKQIREKYASNTNYPLVCDVCAYPLGILHLARRTKRASAYLNRGVKQIYEGKIICPRCRFPYKVSEILGADEKEIKSFPSEAEICLEKLVKNVKNKLRVGKSYH